MIVDGVANYQCTECEIVYGSIEEIDIHRNDESSGSTAGLTYRRCKNCHNKEFTVFIPRIISTGVIGMSSE